MRRRGKNPSPIRSLSNTAVTTESTATATTDSTVAQTEETPEQISSLMEFALFLQGERTDFDPGEGLTRLDTRTLAQYAVNILPIIKSLLHKDSEDVAKKFYAWRLMVLYKILELDLVLGEDHEAEEETIGDRAGRLVEAKVSRTLEDLVRRRIDQILTPEVLLLPTKFVALKSAHSSACQQQMDANVLLREALKQATDLQTDIEELSAKLNIAGIPDPNDLRKFDALLGQAEQLANELAMYLEEANLQSTSVSAITGKFLNASSNAGSAILLMQKTLADAELFSLPVSKELAEFVSQQTRQLKPPQGYIAKFSMTAPSAVIPATVKEFLESLPRFRIILEGLTRPRPPSAFTRPLRRAEEIRNLMLICHYQIVPDEPNANGRSFRSTADILEKARLIFKTEKEEAYECMAGDSARNTRSSLFAHNNRRMRGAWIHLYIPNSMCRNHVANAILPLLNDPTGILDGIEEAKKAFDTEKFKR
ncbi:MAG: hypothetical protein ABIH21_04385 [Patescibacteria group bacterium]